MKLFGTPASPYVRKVRLVLEEKHIAYEYVLTSAATRETMVAPLNPLGKIPVLVGDDGRAVYDSRPPKVTAKTMLAKPAANM